MLKTLWNDESGVILSAEIVLVGTILVLGMLTGLVSLQASVVAELADLASAFGNLDQSYNVSGFYARTADNSHTKAHTRGSLFNDAVDAAACDCQGVTLVCTDAGEK